MRDSHSHTHTLTHSHTHTLTHSHTLTLAHTHSHPHPHTFTLSFRTMACSTLNIMVCTSSCLVGAGMKPKQRLVGFGSVSIFRLFFFSAFFFFGFFFFFGGGGCSGKSSDSAQRFPQPITKNPFGGGGLKKCQPTTILNAAWF